MFSKESRVSHRLTQWKNVSNHFLSFVFLCYMFVMVTGCGAMMVGGAAMMGGVGIYQHSKDHRSEAEIDQDGTIIHTIQSKYVEDPQVNAMDISVNSYLGTVTLHGHVHSESDAQRAIRIAESVTGVRKVLSRLQIGH